MSSSRLPNNFCSPSRTPSGSPLMDVTIPKRSPCTWARRAPDSALASVAWLPAAMADKRITLELDPEAKTWLATEGYEPAYGARPLKRVIQTALQNRLAEMVLRGDVVDGATVTVAVRDGALEFHSSSAEPAAAAKKSKKAVH